MKYPDGKDFIFTIFDDTDVATLKYIKPIYDLLDSVNIKTTKSVWPLAHHEDNDYTGSHTLEDSSYVSYVQELQNKGFEIAYHGATMMTSDREKIKHSLDYYFELLGSYPSTYAPHSINRDILYWGQDRFSFNIFKTLYKILSHDKPDYYKGHIKNSPFFWGDFSLKYLNFVRNFTYDEINLLNICKSLPYSNRRQPYVKSWFFSCDADNVEEFNRLLKIENQNKLENERGVCILSTHFGKGFLKNGAIHPETERLLTALSKRNGWFVPVHTALDFLKNQRSTLEIKWFDLLKLELSWFINSLKRRKKSLVYEQTEIPYLEISKKTN